MDVTSMAFYAGVCGLLSLAAPKLGPWTTRVAAGAVVGVLAAIVLPYVKASMGLGY